MRSSLPFSLQNVTGRENTYQVITSYFMAMHMVLLIAVVMHVHV